MKKYRKKPVVIEAQQITVDNCYDVAKWAHAAIDVDIIDVSTDCNELVQVPGYITLSIATLEGIMKATIGDYVIKGVEGEFYPCKKSVFEKTYEEVK